MFPWFSDSIRASISAWTAGAGGSRLLFGNVPIGNAIFLGLFFGVAAVVVATLALVLVAARRDLSRKPFDVLRWQLEFGDLPRRARVCRHELTGEVNHRTCRNNFDCGACEGHREFQAVRNTVGSTVLPGARGIPEDESIYGFRMPADRLYHRGHTWARAEADGTMTIGLDDIGRRLLGSPADFELPSPGERLHRNGAAFVARKGDAAVRLLSPVDGEVTALGGDADDWTVRVKPLDGGFDTCHLLSGPEIRPWVLREVERLQVTLAVDGSALSLADGGLPVEDFPGNLPRADWDQVWGEMFLEP